MSSSSEMQHPELPVFAFLTAVLVLIPLPWHWRARNIATVSIVIWLFAVNLIYGVNAIIWAGNVNNSAPIWCDISTKIVVGASYALPLSMLCICKHLELVSSSRKVQFDSADRVRRIVFESVMCFGVPLVFMALHYVVQGHRFDIFENTGCQAALYISIQAVMIVWFPQLLFSVITLILAAMALHHFIRRRLTFASHLHNSNSALTPNRYVRLIAMAVTEMVWGTVFTAYNLYNNVSPGLRPWTTWADVHSNFLRVDVFPASTIPPEFLRSMMVFWWIMPVSSIIFFLFFGFGEEAKKEYRKVFAWFMTVILRRNPGNTAKKGGLIPSSVRPLHLVDLKNMTSDKNQLDSAFTGSSSFTVAASSPIKASKTSDIADSDSFMTLSYYGQSATSIHTPESNPVHEVRTSEGYAPPRLPSSDRPYPADVPSYTETDSLPSPVYHRPFSPPSVYPTAIPHPRIEDGIIVTIHRQASVDHIV